MVCQEMRNWLRVRDSQCLDDAECCVFCTQCVLYSVYAVLGVCCIRSMLYSEHAVHSVYCTQCMLNLVLTLVYGIER